MFEQIEKVKCLIIGSGPAGYTAAIYAARANMNPVLYQGSQPGGQLTTTNDVENFPGFSNGIGGAELMLNMQEQAKRFGTSIREGWVVKVDFTGNIHKVWINTGKIIYAETIIISTGASAKYLGLPSEKYYLEVGGGVSACAICDGFFYKNQETIVVGGGDTACEEALHLSKLCSKVSILIRRNDFRASKLMVNRVKNTSNIEIIYNTEIIEIIGEKGLVTGVKVINNKTNNIINISCTGVFIAIGHNPNTNIFKDWLDMDGNGYIKTKAETTKTNIPGVFVSGDAADKIYRQAITAAGTGCKAALEAEKYLSNINNNG